MYFVVNITKPYAHASFIITPGAIENILQWNEFSVQQGDTKYNMNLSYTRDVM